MSLKKDGNKRWVSAEVEVPGTPEEVWRAIATGEGVSSWFVPTERRPDGTVVSHFGPGMDVVARETAWDPPRRFAADSEMAPGQPMATEWIVEAKAGGTCIVRVVHSLVSEEDRWDDQLEQIEKGWPDYFHILRSYLQHFAGRPAACVQLVGVTKMPAADAWAKLTLSLGFAGAGVGDRRRAPEGAPAFGGVVEVGPGSGHPHHFLVRADHPCDALVHAFAMEMGPSTVVVARLYFYGLEARTVATREEPVWQSWLVGQFPMAVA